MWLFLSKGFSRVSQTRVKSSWKKKTKYYETPLRTTLETILIVKVAVAPDGNGGLYLALVINSVLTNLQERGIKHLHAYCVDNCLVRIADPTFIGYSLTKSLSIATKVVRKRAPDEPVGLVVLKDGKQGVIEYSEISEREAHETVNGNGGKGDGKDGKVLRFRAANIVNHYYSMEFLAGAPHWATTLPHHIARKKIPYTDLQSGEKVLPTTPNGIKLEQFVFDVFDLVPLAKFGLFEVAREDEFSPLKNGPAAKVDNPVTSRRDVLLQGRRWLEAVGTVVLDDGDRETGVEISPLVSYGGEGLEFLKGREIKAPAVIADKGGFDKLAK
jgi:UDP-N-acetylglucosamine/UDP-N-acetylgalactosamine diphosphorylase